MKQATATAHLRKLRIAPRKVRLLIDLIRGMQVEEARRQLQFSSKAAARPVLKLLESAVANAVNNHKMVKETLVIQKATVDGGPIMYRWMPRAFGRAGKIRKRTSHITLVLSGNAPIEAEKQVAAEASEVIPEAPEKTKKTVAKSKTKKTAAKAKTTTKKENN